ncbi:DUF6114 domain-containing protein [Kitasatospora sp. NPDC057223]|uniref:DUF6114 domain-containing protein n=1 Tax=Kitasatospora sp. NPDC057223 TaxID=3346055 RepID=UPI00362A108F
MSSATAPVWPDEAGGVTRLRLRFRTWRRTRPFWAGVLAMVAGVPILYFPYAKLSFNGMTVAMSTTAGSGSLIIGILLMVLGLTAWYQPMSRIFAGVATTLLTLVSIPVSNLAGFGLALIPGLVGGGLMVAWAPLKEPEAAEPAAEPAAHHDAGALGDEPTAVQGVIPAQAGEPEEAR